MTSQMDIKSRATGMYKKIREDSEMTKPPEVSCAKTITKN